MNIYYLVRKLDMTLQIKIIKLIKMFFSYLLWKENNTDDDDDDGMHHVLLLQTKYFLFFFRINKFK